MELLLASKLQKPVLFEKYIKRENIVAVLQEIEHSKVVFISAPTGYGKSTFLTHWTSEINDAIAWLTLDAADNDPLQFWRYAAHTLFTANQCAVPDRLKAAFTVSDQDEWQNIITVLLEECSRLPAKTKLVIDDFHVITNSVLHTMIQVFINQLPPQISIYFASRHQSPFAGGRCCSNVKVTEIGVEQLRFTYGDMAEFFQMRNIQWQTYELIWKSLIETEGWPAGLHLAVQLNKLGGIFGIYDIEQYKCRISNILDEELWNELSPAVKKFLLYTSVLETANPSICNALMGWEYSDDVLKQLMKEGFFVEKKAGEESSFRYHRLFANALRRKLNFLYPQDFIADLHKNAAMAYYKQRDIVQAIDHALAGGAYGLAVTWMTSYGTEIVRNKQTAIFAGWYSQLDSKKIRMSSELKMLAVFSLIAEDNIEKADDTASSMTAKENIEEWTAYKNYSKTASYDYFLLKSYITILKMGGAVEIGQWLQQSTAVHMQQYSDFYTLPLSFNKKEPLLSRTKLGTPQKLYGEEAYKFRREFNQTHANKLSIIGYCHGIQAEKLYARGKLKDAAKEQIEAMMLAHHFRDEGLFIPMYILRAKMHIANNEMEKAHETIEKAAKFTQEEQWTGYLLAFKAYIYSKENRLQLAVSEMNKLCDIQSASLQQHPFIMLMQARVLLEGRQYKSALERIIRVKMEALKEQQVTTFIEASILEAKCCAGTQNWTEMASALQEALFYGKEYGYIQMFLDEENIQSLLQMYMKVRKGSKEMSWVQVPIFFIDRLLKEADVKKDILVLLTPREKEVYSLLALGASNRDISKKLSIAEGSVRIYLTSIYEKLDVSSRTQAILRKYE